MVCHINKYTIQSLFAENLNENGKNLFFPFFSRFFFPFFVDPHIICGTTSEKKKEVKKF